MYMMRFFRGKDIKTGDWVYGDLIISKNQYYIHPTHNSFQVKESGLSGPIVLHEVREETVGQFTGRVDKNGNKVFEGDICTGSNILYPSRDIYHAGFDDGLFGLYDESGILWHFSHLDNVEVIGNIFDDTKKDV